VKPGNEAAEEVAIRSIGCGVELIGTAGYRDSFVLGRWFRK